ncbi:MAG: hemZ, partial [Clostridiales bacterium]|nr:hemZ [Clostridiales bacterium]
MINVKLKGHEYRYEAYQILSLFYAKSEIVFNMFESDIESTFDTQLSLVECEIKSALISKKLHVNILDKKNIKNSIKMTLLKCLEEFTGITIPWGILVGIRPTKVIHDYFNKGLAEDEIIMHLTNDYSLSIEKCNLAIEVAKKEAVFLNKANKSVSIYIGIPFCPTRCVYCSFTSNPIWKNQDLVNCYLNSLLKEINSVFSYLKDSGYNIDTLYVGGGTPTSLNVHQLNKLLSNINY